MSVAETTAILSLPTYFIMLSNVKGNVVESDAEQHVVWCDEGLQTDQSERDQTCGEALDSEAVLSVALL